MNLPEKTTLDERHCPLCGRFQFKGRSLGESFVQIRCSSCKSVLLFERERVRVVERGRRVQALTGSVP